jgi:hypothetical protein
MTTAAPAAIGRVIQITGPVVDIEFPAGSLPGIYNAVEIQREGQEPLVCEVQQHLGNNWVRAVAMTTTDGLARGVDVRDTGAPITVPVGEATLGRVFDVLGHAIDEKGPVNAEVHLPIHRDPPAFDQQGVSEKDLLDYTPELKAESQRIIDQYTYGQLFTPPEVVGTPLPIDQYPLAFKHYLLLRKFYGDPPYAEFGGLTSEQITGLGLTSIALAAVSGIAGITVANFWTGLVLLGLGWNLAFIGATTMVTQCHRPHERNKVQAFNDFLIFGSMALSSFSSGQLLDKFGWTAINEVIFPTIFVAGALLLWLALRPRESTV